jgi:pectate lyase-like protein
MSQAVDRKSSAARDERMAVVRRFAAAVLAHATDRFGTEHTPLFLDGLNYLDLGERIADNLIRQHFIHDLFVPSAKHVYTRVDALEPLALLSLEAALRGEPDRVPAYTGGVANFTCPYDGVGRRQENALIYARTVGGG